VSVHFTVPVTTVTFQ